DEIETAAVDRVPVAPDVVAPTALDAAPAVAPAMAAQALEPTGTPRLWDLQQPLVAQTPSGAEPFTAVAESAERTTEPEPVSEVPSPSVEHHVFRLSGFTAD